MVLRASKVSFGILLGLVCMGAARAQVVDVQARVFAGIVMAASAAPPDYSLPGPLPVGWNDVVLPLGTTLTITNRIYYPAVASGMATAADPTHGPYPLVGLIHGATVAPDDYDVVSSHVASHGFVVASLGGMASEPLPLMASETKEFMDWVVAESATPGSSYSGMVWGGDYGVIASSRGGAATKLLLAMEPKLRAAAMMEPSDIGGTTGDQNVGAWTGDWLFLAGSIDSINPPAEVRRYLGKATSAARRLYVEMQGAGHSGCLDPDTPGLPTEPLTQLEQLELHGQIVTAFLDAELRGVEDADHQILGSGAADDPLIHETTCVAPLLWAVERAVPPKTVSIGLAGSAGDLAVLVLAFGTASIPTPYGTLLIDPYTAGVIVQTPLGVGGTVEVNAAVPPGVSGLVVHVQGLVLNSGGAFTRADALVLP